MRRYSERLVEDGFIILLFHGVVPESRWTVRNHTFKHLPVDRFQEVLRDLRDHGNPVSMPEVLEAAERGASLPPRSFAVTFDDGFENNYSIAAPLLEKWEIPATFYVATHFIGSESVVWVDRLEYALETTRRCELALKTAPLQGVFGTPAEKRGAMAFLRRAVKSDPNMDGNLVADEAWAQLGITHMPPDPFLDQKLDWDQVKRLAEHKLFTVGGHSHTHPILSYLPAAEMRREIVVSLGLLNQHLGYSPVHYSYPEGLPHCYSEDVIKVLKESGVKCTTAVEDGINHIGDDLFRLKRLLVPLGGSAEVEGIF